MTQVEVEGLTQRREDTKIGKRVRRGWEEAIMECLKTLRLGVLSEAGVTFLA